MAINESNRLAVLQESPGSAMQLHCVPLNAVLQARYDFIPGARPALLYKRGKLLRVATHRLNTLMTCLSLQQLLSRQLRDYSGMQRLLAACHLLTCIALQAASKHLMMPLYGVLWPKWPLEEAVTGAHSAPIAGSEQGSRGLDGDMVQTYDFRSVSGQPDAASGQDAGLGTVRGLCLAALSGSDDADPVRTALAPQLTRL